MDAARTAEPHRCMGRTAIMTVAHPGADHCALCLLKGALTPAMKLWPGAPLCRQHVAECIEANEPNVIDMKPRQVRHAAAGEQE
jgi:hypothetical protein